MPVGQQAAEIAAALGVSLAFEVRQSRAVSWARARWARRACSGVYRKGFRLKRCPNT